MEKEYVVSQLRAIYKPLCKIVESIQYNGGDPRQRLVMAYLASIVEGYVGCVELINVGIYSQVPMLTRSVIEALVDLEFVIEKEEALIFLSAESVKVQLDYANDIIAKKGFPEKMDAFIAQKEKHENSLKRLKREGYKHRNWTDKLSASKLPDNIKVTCKICSTAAHNNVIELIKRHAEGKAITTICYFKEFDIKRLKTFVVAICECLIIATEKACAYYNIVPSQSFLDAIAIYNKFGPELEALP